MKDPCFSDEKKGLLSVNEALQRIERAISPIGDVEWLDLKSVLGRTLVQTITATMNLPSAQSAAMDGYAFSSQGMDATHDFSLRCVGASWAGRPFTGELRQGECVRIFTGALMPEGTDSVVMQEQARVEGHHVYFGADTTLQKNVRCVGEDIEQGQIICRAGEKLSPIDLGLLASLGQATLPVTRQVAVTYFSTGDELQPLDKPLKRGNIYDSNRYLLHALLHHPCFSVSDGGVVADDKKALQAALLQAAQSSDVIITTGGASVGEADFVREVLQECGTVDFWKIAIKPGKPLAFGNIGTCYFFGLPGNPLAVTTTFDVFVKPALNRLSGQAFSSLIAQKALCTTALKTSLGRESYVQATLSQSDDGYLTVASTGQQGSHLLSSAQKANAYIVLPADCDRVEAGQWVSVLKQESSSL